MFHFLRSYLKYFLYKVDAHSLHSPFVYNLFNKVIKAKRELDPCVERLRQSLDHNPSIIHVEDYGFGKDKNPERKINRILNTAVSKPQKAAFLRDLTRYLSCKSIIELGTSLGLTSMYLATAESSRLITFEGSDSLASMARNHFNTCGFKNIEVITGNLDQTFKEFVKQKTGTYDCFYFDANHLYAPTLSYYQLARQISSTKSIFIFDDIHHNKEMDKAWKEIVSKNEVTLSIDLFYMGLVFFETNLPKKHYILSGF